jgi:hypothetical protein
MAICTFCGIDHVDIRSLRNGSFRTFGFAGTTGNAIRGNCCCHGDFLSLSVVFLIFALSILLPKKGMHNHDWRVIFDIIFVSFFYQEKT